METRNILGRAVPLPVVLIVILVVLAIAFLLGNIGNIGGGNSTTSVNATVTPADVGLKPGASRAITVVVKNPLDQGARVASISASRSEAAEGCPAGALTSTEVSNPVGYIRPQAINAYPVPVTVAADAPEGCLNQALTVPLTIELVTAQG